MRCTAKIRVESGEGSLIVQPGDGLDITLSDKVFNESPSYRVQPTDATDFWPNMQDYMVRNLLGDKQYFALKMSVG